MGALRSCRRSPRRVRACPYGSHVLNDRDWLARRIETEARAYANADSTTRDIRWGRVLGFLEVGTHLGYWPARRATEVADSIQQRYGLSKILRAHALRE